MNLLNRYFDACAHPPEQGHTVVLGAVILTGAVLRFESEETTLEIPTYRLIAEIEDGPEPVLAFTDAAQPGLKISTTDFELLECPLPSLARVRQDWSARLSRRELNRRLRILAGCLVVCAALTVAGSFLMSHMVRSIAGRVPPEWDARLGTSVMAEISRNEATAVSSNAVSRIAALAEPLLRALPGTTNGYQFHIVESQSPNAFALPGRHIVVTTGLLELMEPEELLGILAHEMAHVTERHLYRKAISTTGPLAICQLFFGQDGGWANLMGVGAASMAGAGFSQEYETEADLTGWNYLLAANINPRGMIRALQKLSPFDAARPARGLPPQALRSHPSLEKRINRLEARWNQLPHKTGFTKLPPHKIGTSRQ